MKKGLGLLLFGVFMCFVAFTLHQANAENDDRKEDAVTPVPSTNDNIIPEYIEAVHEQTAACDALVKTLEKCDATLEVCLDMLEGHYLIPKEKKP